MKMQNRILAAAIVASTAAWLAAPASAAPRSESLALKSAMPASTETVALRRHRVIRDDGYFAYGLAGTPQGVPPRTIGKLCSDVGDANSATPSWMCLPGPH